MMGGMESKPQQMEDLKAFVKRWQEWGPKLQAIKDDELRRMTAEQRGRALVAVMDAVKHMHIEQPTSGLFEQQRLLAALRP